ncbi:hypothetical protein ACP0FU_25720, partial [Escherichia coli]
NQIYLCAISNIESGTCNEDCKFCTQSVKYKADIQRYRRKEIEVVNVEAKAEQTTDAVSESTTDEQTVDSVEESTTDEQTIELVPESTVA